MASKQQDVKELVERKYEHGFVTDIESETLPPGIDESVIRHISKMKGEPQFMLDWRLKAFAPLAGSGGTGLGQTGHRPDRLSGHFILLRP